MLGMGVLPIPIPDSQNSTCELVVRHRCMSAEDAPDDPTVTQTSGSLSQVPSLETAHVLFMDIVDYSCLSMDQQTEKVHLLQKIVRASPEFRRGETDKQLVRL